jgi:hypothetical protein
MEPRRVRGINGYALVEKAVAAHAVAVECPYVLSHFERGPAIHARRLHPSQLSGRIIRHFVLEKDVRTAIAGPDHFIFLIVLDKKSVGGDAVGPASPFADSERPGR